MTIATVAEMNKKKLFAKVLSGSGNVRFGDVVTLAEAFGFRLVRISRSHHILGHPMLSELLNLQNWKGKAKPYQIRQLQRLIEDYDLSLEEEP